MHSTNGNIKKFLDIHYQNIPQTYGLSLVQTSIDVILDRYKSDVLFLGEVVTLIQLKKDSPHL